VQSFGSMSCNELKNRGVEDILIACKDGLTGFSEAINAVFPQTELQLCVIHQIRNSIKVCTLQTQKGNNGRSEKSLSGYNPWKKQSLPLGNLKKNGVTNTQL
jgi:transposase-like protein